MNILRTLTAGVVLGLAVSTAVQARPWADIEKSGTLIAATGGDLKPFNYFEGKELTGFEVELTQALAERLGLKLEWKVLSFDSLLAGLQRDRWDLVISSHGITEDRAKVVDFSDPHYCGGATIVAKNPAISKKTDLAGKTVAVQTGTSFLAALQKDPDIGTVKNFPLDRDARAAVVSGRADAWVTDKFVAAEAIRLVPEAGLHIGELLFVERMAAAVGKGNTGLVAAFNQALAGMMADGSYEKLSRKYFDMDIRCQAD